MNEYKAFYKDKEIEVYAETSYAAQVKAAKHFKARCMAAVAVELFEENVLVDGYENVVRRGKQVFGRNDG